MLPDLLLRDVVESASKDWIHVSLYVQMTDPGERLV